MLQAGRGEPATATAERRARQAAETLCLGVLSVPPAAVAAAAASCPRPGG